MDEKGFLMGLLQRPNQYSQRSLLRRVNCLVQAKMVIGKPTIHQALYVTKSGLLTSSSHRIVAVDAMQPTASGVSMRWRCCDTASMVIVAGLWTSPAPSQLIFVRIHWLLHSAASIDSALRAIRCSDIVAAPEEKRRSHSADIAGIDSASLARLGHLQVLSRQ